MISMPLKALDQSKEQVEAALLAGLAAHLELGSALATVAAQPLASLLWK